VVGAEDVTRKIDEVEDVVRTGWKELAGHQGTRSLPPPGQALSRQAIPNVIDSAQRGRDRDTCAWFFVDS
jgi:hypothetical protein